MSSSELPDGIRPFECHGANLRPPQGGSGDWQGDCLMCGKAKHFYVSPKTGLCDCKVCGFEGNAISFLTELAKTAYASTPRTALLELAKNRGTVKVDGEEFSKTMPVKILRARKIGWDGSQWLIPCFSEKGTVRDLRRYVPGRLVMSTSGCKAQLGGVERLKKRRGRVWICEGEWDALAMDWIIDELDLKDDVAVWVPGAGTFKDEWTHYFNGRDVVAVYDNDEAGDRGAEKCYKKLGSVAKTLKFVNWPDSRPDGYDLRDFVVQGMAVWSAQDVFDGLEELMAARPKRVKGSDGRSVDHAEGMPELEPVELDELLATFRKYVLMDAEMVDALKVVLATALSNALTSDPLWLYLVGPPGTGKTLLLSSLQSSDRCVFRSTVTPHCLVSGWRGNNDNDPSLLPKLKGKTFVAKDFTEILTLPSVSQDEIFSTLRGAYDGQVQKTFGNGINRDYRDCRFAMLAGVTHAIHANAKASLGERFLKFQLSEPGQERANDIVKAAILGVGREKEMEEELQYVTACFLTKPVDPEQLPRMSMAYQERLTALVQLIAVLRANVERDFRTREVVYRPTPEVGTRLAKQLVKLAMMMAFVEDKPEIDEDVYRIVEKVAYDTAYGFPLDVLNAMMELGGTASKNQVAEKTGLPASTTIYYKFEDLLMLKAIKLKPDIETSTRRGGRPGKIYQVTDKISALWQKAKGREAWKQESIGSPDSSRLFRKRSARRARSRSRRS